MKFFNFMNKNNGSFCQAFTCFGTDRHSCRTVIAMRDERNISFAGQNARSQQFYCLAFRLFLPNVTFIDLSHRISHLASTRIHGMGGSQQECRL